MTSTITKVATKRKSLFSISSIIFFVLCLVVFFLVFHYSTELKTIKKLFEQIDPWWIAAALLTQLLTYLSTAYIYHVLINQYKDRTAVTFTELLKMTIITVFINQVIPAGGVGGNGFLYNELGKREVSSQRGFFTIIMECLSLYVAMIGLLIVIPVLYIANYHHLPRIFIIVIIVGFGLYAFLSVIMTILSKKDSIEWVIKKLSWFKSIKHYFEDSERTFQGTFQEYGTTGAWHTFLRYKTATMKLILGQWGVFFSDALTLFALVKGLHIHTTFLIVVFGLLLTTIVSAIPFSPGALLLYEGSMTYFFSLMGIPFQTALVLTLLYRALSFWLPLFVGLALYKNITKSD